MIACIALTKTFKLLHTMHSYCLKFINCNCSYNQTDPKTQSEKWFRQNFYWYWPLVHGLWLCLLIPGTVSSIQVQHHSTAQHICPSWRQSEQWPPLLVAEQIIGNTFKTLFNITKINFCDCSQYNEGKQLALNSWPLTL